MFRLLGIVTISTVLTGCTSSVHPLLAPTDLTGEIDLNGTWETQLTGRKEKGVRGVTPARIMLSGFANKTSYDFSIAAGPDEVEDFILEVGRIGDDLYLQWQLVEPPRMRGPWLTGIRVYGFARFEVESNEVRLYRLNDEWCERAARSGRFPHIFVQPSELGDPYTVITLSTPDLQTFVAEHRDEMFESKPTVWRKVDAAPRPDPRPPVVAPRHRP